MLTGQASTLAMTAFAPSGLLSPSEGAPQLPRGRQLRCALDSRGQPRPYQPPGEKARRQDAALRQARAAFATRRSVPAHAPASLTAPRQAPATLIKLVTLHVPSGR
jgi:hypothetical protein